MAAFLKSFSFSSVKILKHSKRNSVKSGRQSASLITELVINRCNEDGELHLLFTEKEKPCEEAYIKELLDSDGNKCSRYFIDLDTITELDKLGEKYDTDVLVTKNLDFPEYTAIILYDEEIKQED